jgi:hypothetical protein
MSSKHFNALLSYNDSLYSIAVCRFAIKMSHIIRFHPAVSQQIKRWSHEAKSKTTIDIIT